MRLAVSGPHDLAPRDLVLHLQELRQPVARHVFGEPLHVDVVCHVAVQRVRWLFLFLHLLRWSLHCRQRLLLWRLLRLSDLRGGREREGPLRPGQRDLLHAGEAHQPAAFLAGRRGGHRRGPLRAAAPAGVVPREDQVVAAWADPVPGHHGLRRRGAHDTSAGDGHGAGRAATLALRVPRELQVVARRAEPVARAGCRSAAASALAGAQATHVAHQHREHAPLHHGGGVGRQALPAVGVAREDEIAAVRARPVAGLRDALLHRRQTLLHGSQALQRVRVCRATPPARHVLRKLQVATAWAGPVTRFLRQAVARSIGWVRVSLAALVALGVPRKLEVLAGGAVPVAGLQAAAPAQGGRRAAAGEQRVGRPALPALRVPGKLKVATAGAVPVTRLLHHPSCCYPS
mmetsp:Transcript_96493/g.268164  ORF Transcript_96493/g.268164 Transcript_96493/m.268164 type:complete len:403 (+) Transcript_96493:385-1593(+)